MIDLHLHTTASDGTLDPAALVATAAARRITVLSVTDHDTLAGLEPARAAAGAAGLRLIDGIEITAVEDQRDVHVLAYDFDPADEGLGRFLTAQREDRVRRVEEIISRLRALGCPIDAAPLLERARCAGHSVGRPHVAAALVEAGLVATRDEAFDRFLDRSAPAFVPRRGARVEAVIEIVAAAGGVTSLAHPGLTRVDHLVQGFADAGLHAIEVRHSDHDGAMEQHYRQVAARYGLAVSGGSDFHGFTSHHRCGLGEISIEPEELERLLERRA